MPIYEYTCADCQHEFEALMRAGDRAGCPSCGQSNLERRLSVPAAPATKGQLPLGNFPSGGPCGMGGCGRPECE